MPLVILNNLLVGSFFPDARLLPGFVAYALHPRLESWEVSGGCLRLRVMVPSRKPVHTRWLLGGRGRGGAGSNPLGQVAKAAERDLADFFACEVFVSLNVEVLHPARHQRLEAASLKDGGNSPTLGMFV